jgi:hypothetical protein
MNTMHSHYILLALLAFSPNIQAQWSQVKVAQTINKPSSEIAISIDESGRSFAVYRVQDGSVWARFSVANNELWDLLPSRLPIVQVDTFETFDLQSLAKMKEHSPWMPSFVFAAPRAVEYRMWQGDPSQGFAPGLAELAHGTRLVVRYCLSNRKAAAASFDLAGAKKVLEAVLGTSIPSIEQAKGTIPQWPPASQMPDELRKSMDDQKKRQHLDSFHTCPPNS